MYVMTNTTTENNLVPTEFYLCQNYPNPFKDRTTIKYSIPAETKVKLTVFNSSGEMIRKLVDDIKGAGTYEVEFSAKGGSASGGDAYSLSSVTYFYHLEAGSYSNLKKMISLK